MSGKVGSVCADRLSLATRRVGTWQMLIDKLNTPLILYYAGQSNVVDAVTRNHYREVQQPIWERLAEERLRVVEAKLKISGAYYMALSLEYLGCW